MLEGLNYGSRCGFCFKGDGVLFFVWLWVLVLICCVGVVGWGEEVSEGWGFNYGEVGVCRWGVALNCGGSRWGFVLRWGLGSGCVLFVLIFGDRVLVFNNEVI